MLKVVLSSIIACGAILTLYVYLLVIINTGGLEQFHGVNDIFLLFLIFMFMVSPYIRMVAIFRSVEITTKIVLITLSVVILGLFIQYPAISWAHLQFLLIIGPGVQHIAIWVAKLSGQIKIV